MADFAALTVGSPATALLEIHNFPTTNHPSVFILQWIVIFSFIVFHNNMLTYYYKWAFRWYLLSQLVGFVLRILILLLLSAWKMPTSIMFCFSFQGWSTGNWLKDQWRSIIMQELGGCRNGCRMGYGDSQQRPHSLTSSRRRKVL